MDFSLSSSLVGSAVSNPDKLALDLQFATDKTLTARKGPTPAFTRGSNATVVGSNGLVRYAPNNASLYSGQLVVGTGWGANTTPSVTSIVDGLGPDGNNAYEIAEIANTGTHTLFNTGGTSTTGATSVVSGTTYTGSIFVKKVAGSVDWIQLSFSTVGFGSAQYANFNISNGTIGNSSSSSPQIQDAGNGWYRCSISAVATATTTTTSNLFLAFTNNTDTVTRLLSYAGNTANKVLAAMCQFEIGATVNTYNPTTTAAFQGPRFDHDPVTLACKGLLIEESRTNDLIRSNDFADASWVKTSITVGSTTNLSPDGGTNATLLIAGSSAVSWIYRSGVTVSGKSLTYFAKSSGKRWSVVDASSGAGTAGVWFDLQNGVVGTVASGYTASIEPFPNGFYRCRVTHPASGAGSFTVIGVSDNNSFFVSTGSGSNGIIIYGAQLEAGSFPTSYIPTTTASVIRSADVCSISGSAFSGFYNQPEGTLVTSSSRTSTNTNAFIGHYSDNSFNNGFDVRYPASTQVSALMNVANSNQVASMQVTITAGSVVKQAFSYKFNDCGYSVNGAATITDTSALIPTATRMVIGNAAVPSTVLYLNGTVSSIRYFKKRLSNAKLQTLTV